MHLDLEDECEAHDLLAAPQRLRLGDQVIRRVRPQVLELDVYRVDPLVGLQRRACWRHFLKQAL